MYVYLYMYQHQENSWNLTRNTIMTTLTVACNANQATTLPTLLVASYAKFSVPNTSINITFEDVENLHTIDGAATELVLMKDPPVYGTDKIIEKLLEIHFSLQVKHENLVGYERIVLMKSIMTGFSR